MSTINVNFGQGSIAPAGTGRLELALGPTLFTCLKAEVGASRKDEKNQGLRLNLKVKEAPKGPEYVGSEIEDFMMFPQGDDFSESTNQGKANRARVAEIKSLMVAIGYDATAVTQMNGQLSLDLSSWAGRDLPAFYEPSVYDAGHDYPSITWVSPAAWPDVVAGKLHPRLKNDPAKPNAKGKKFKTAAAPMTPGAAPTQVGTIASMMGAATPTPGVAPIPSNGAAPQSLTATIARLAGA